MQLLPTTWLHCAGIAPLALSMVGFNGHFCKLKGIADDIML